MHILEFFKLAGETALSKDDFRSFSLGAVGIRNDGVLVRALNGPDMNKNRKAHAEFKLCRKLGACAEAVFVARMRSDNQQFAMAKPCVSCRKILRTKKVEKVFFTIDQFQYGIWFPSSNLERIYEFKGG